MTAKPKRSLGPAPLLYPEPALLIATYDSAGKPLWKTRRAGGVYEMTRNFEHLFCLTETL